MSRAERDHTNGIPGLRLEDAQRFLREIADDVEAEFPGHAGTLRLIAADLRPAGELYELASRWTGDADRITELALGRDERGDPNAGYHHGRAEGLCTAASDLRGLIKRLDPRPGAM